MDGSSSHRSNRLQGYLYIDLCIQWGVEIEFDPEKAAVNPINHAGVTFDEAKYVLLDPYTLTREDADVAGEARFISLGMGGKGRILVVVWTLRGNNPRIISA